jgi:hypothetical protein
MLPFQIARRDVLVRVFFLLEGLVLGCAIQLLRSFLIGFALLVRHSFAPRSFIFVVRPGL